MRILVVKLGSIGDIVHTLPAVAAIRAAMPQSEISWVVERRSAEILRDNPILDRLIEVDTKALRRGLMSGETLRAPRQQLRRLRASAFDLALDFQGLLKSASIARLSGARRIFGFSRDSLREPASRILLSKSIPIPPKTHVIRKNLALVSGALGIPVPDNPDDLAFPIATAPADVAEALGAAKSFEDSYAILNPGGGWPTKLWSAERFGRLADELWSHYGLRSLITYGPGEAELAETVLRSNQSGIARSVSVSLKGFYELAKRASVYVGGDTGPTHIAIAAGAPIVGLFGPTEWWRNGSLRPDDVCVERVDIDCRTDCHRRACSNWICMDIEVDRVLQAVGRRLNVGHERVGQAFLKTTGQTKISGPPEKSTTLRRGGTWLQRWRVPLGFLCGAVFLLFARPRPSTLLPGLIISIVGLLVRAWAAGHIRKNSALATSGPYAYTRNPLYAGSFLLGLGFTIGSGRWALAILFAALFLGIYLPVMRVESGTLAELFGESFQRYARSVPLFFPRFTPYRSGEDKTVFDSNLYLRYREYRAALGLLVAWGLLVVKAYYLK